MVANTISFTGSINRRMVVQAGSSKNTKPYSKITQAKMAGV
jgi:hypothetical protein